MHRELKKSRNGFLSTDIAVRSESRIALGFALVSGGCFLLAAPFASVPLVRVDAFIPVYESALIIGDFITAGLLFGQFNILRSQALFVLACGYLFTAFGAIAHMLSFPGVFSPVGLLGGGSQSTAWLYLCWHAGFPLFVMLYAFLKDKTRGKPAISRPDGPSPAGGSFSILAGVVAVFAVVFCLTLATTSSQDALPTLMLGNQFAPVLTGLVSAAWMLSFIALIVLWWQRPHTVLDLWLMVVMTTWLLRLVCPRRSMLVVSM